MYQILTFSNKIDPKLCPLTLYNTYRRNHYLAHNHYQYLSTHYLLDTPHLSILTVTSKGNIKAITFLRFKFYSCLVVDDIINFRLQ